MFEKEAEEYALMKLVNLEDFDSYQSAYDRFENGVQDAFQDGAEFGYNKANEWHFDEVPDNENDILCQIAEDESVVGYYSESKKRYYTIDGQNIDVIAWKEIVLPELPKEDRNV